MLKVHRQDDTFVIEKDEYPFHVTPEMPEYADLLAEYQENPQSFTEEIPVVEQEPDYQERRAMEYPPITEYLDAQVKLNSGDEALRTAGQAQLEAYYAACLAVKARHPKPENNKLSK